MIRPLPTLCLALIAALSLSALPAPGPSALVASPDGPLEGAMHEMDGALKELEQGVTAENRAAALETLAKFQAAVITAKAQPPPHAEKIEEKKRAAYVNEFRKDLVQALQLACQAELAIVDGKYKDADGLIRNKLKGLESAGHGKFKNDPKGGK